MLYRATVAGDSASLVSLFTATFSESEGGEEGALIGRLVAGLLGLEGSAGVRGFVATDANEPVAAILFSPLDFDSGQAASLLSPVAVTPGRQGQGLGQGLIRYGLQQLEVSGVRYAVTYGDPAFYSKVGFRALDPGRAVPPRALSQPIGWIGQGLGGADLGELRGRCRCVAPFDDGAYW